MAVGKDRLEYRIRRTKGYENRREMVKVFFLNNKGIAYKMNNFEIKSDLVIQQNRNSEDEEDLR